MTNFKNGAALALTALLAAGCASTPKTIPELETARAELRQAKGDPLAQEAAGIRLNEAEAAFAVAEKSATQRKPLALIQHQSYLATQHARSRSVGRACGQRFARRGDADRSRECRTR
jgi:hypothetical protein